jgi:hypothetical protein
MSASLRAGVASDGYLQIDNADILKITAAGIEPMPGKSISGAGAIGGIFYENDQTVTADYTITAGKNAGSFGPISIDVGVTVTIPVGSTWSIC